MSDIRSLGERIKPNKTDSGDGKLYINYVMPVIV